MIARVIELADGDILICGRAPGANSAAHLLRVSPRNEIRWARSYGDGTAVHQCTDVLELPGGDLIAVGYRGAQFTENRGLAFRLTSSGSLLWAREATTETQLQAVALNAAGNLLAVGQFGTPTTGTALAVELTTAGAEVATLSLSSGFRFKASWVGRASGNDMLTVLTPTNGGSGLRVMRLTSANTLRRGWSAAQADDVAFDGTGKVLFNSGPLLRIFDTDAETQLGYNLGSNVRRVHPTSTGVVGVRATASLSFVDDITTSGSTWNVAYASVEPSLADCIQTKSGAFHCVTQDYLLRLNSPSLPPECLRTTGQAFTSGASTPSDPSPVIYSVASRSALMADLPAAKLNTLAVTTSDQCPP